MNEKFLKAKMVSQSENEEDFYNDVCLCEFDGKRTGH